MNHSHDLYQGRIYAKATNDMELTHSYCAVCIVMIFIANYKEMIRYLLFSTFA